MLFLSNFTENLVSMINSPNIKLTNTAKNTIKKAEAEAKALELLDSRKKENAKWSKMNWDFHPYYPDRLPDRFKNMMLLN